MNWKNLISSTLTILLVTGSALANDGATVLIEKVIAFRALDGSSLVSIPPGLYAVTRSGSTGLELRSRTSALKVKVKADIVARSGLGTGLEAILEKDTKSGARRLTLLLPQGKALSVTDAGRRASSSNQETISSAEQTWEMVNPVQSPIGDWVDTEPAPMFRNRISHVFVREDRFNYQLIEVHYMYEGSPSCLDQNGVIRGEVPELPVSHYTITSVVVLPQPANSQNVMARTVELKIEYKGLVPQRSDNLQLYLDCARYVDGTHEPLAKKKLSIAKWWAFDPPDSLDGDLVADAAEAMLAAKYAPQVRLAPGEFANPASVDWYLNRVSMRFNHGGGCRDHEVLGLGKVNQQNIASQQHQKKKGKWGLCTHTEEIAYSDSSDRFFLQPSSEETHRGSSNPDDWVAYAHVNGCQSATSGHIAVQYWLFYPYNDAFASVNHEGDWEHVTVHLDELGGNPSSVFLSQHLTGTLIASSEISWSDGTHPVVYSARGTHANYPRVGDYNIPDFNGIPIPVKDKARDGGSIWQTWTRVINVGEIGDPLNNQLFTLFAGRWGEIGVSQYTSGPVGPALKESFEGELPNCTGSSSPGNSSSGISDGKFCPPPLIGCEPLPNGKYMQCVGAKQECP